MNTNSSRHLRQQARHGDRKAVEGLLQRYVLPLQRWATGRLPGARPASETNAFVRNPLQRTFSRRDALELGHEGALSYLRQAIITHISDKARGQAQVPGDRGGRSPLDQAIGRAAVERYERALGKLLPNEREAIIARVELGYRYDDVAAAVGCSSADEARMLVIKGLLNLAEEMRRGA